LISSTLNKIPRFHNELYGENIFYLSENNTLIKLMLRQEVIDDHLSNFYEIQGVVERQITK